MGQYRLSVYVEPWIGLGVTINSQEIIFMLPFIHIFIGKTKEARGIKIFGVELQEEVCR